MILFAILAFSCKKDEGGQCTTCASEQTEAFQVCEDGNGNAVVNGQVTGVPFDSYVLGLEEAGAACGI